MCISNIEENSFCRKFVKNTGMFNTEMWDTNLAMALKLFKTPLNIFSEKRF